MNDKKELINKFEKAINEANQAIGELANKHEKIEAGVIEYWEEKINPILHDLKVLKAQNNLDLKESIDNHMNDMKSQYLDEIINFVSHEIKNKSVDEKGYLVLNVDEGGDIYKKYTSVKKKADEVFRKSGFKVSHYSYDYYGEKIKTIEFKFKV